MGLHTACFTTNDTSRKQVNLLLFPCSLFIRTGARRTVSTLFNSDASHNPFEHSTMVNQTQQGGDSDAQNSRTEAKAARAAAKAEAKAERKAQKTKAKAEKEKVKKLAEMAQDKLPGDLSASLDSTVSSAFLPAAGPCLSRRRATRARSQKPMTMTTIPLLATPPSTWLEASNGKCLSTRFAGADQIFCSLKRAFSHQVVGFSLPQIKIVLSA